MSRRHDSAPPLPPSFPGDPWYTVPPELRAVGGSALAALRENLRAAFAAPRSSDLALAFLEEMGLPPGRLLFYPASQQANAACARFTEDHHRILGFLDRRGTSLGRHLGFPVYAPEAARNLDFDYIVIFQHVREAYFVEQLDELGIDRTKIFTIFDNPAFRTFAQRGWTPDECLPAAARETTKNVLVVSHRQTIVDDDHLAEVYDPRETVIIYLGLPTSNPRSRFFRIIQVGMSLDRLERVLQLIEPARIYVATLVADHYLPMLVRDMVPNAQIVHDLYDTAVICPDQLIGPLHAAPRWQIDASRVGEWFSAQDSDLIISKRRGPCWDHVLRGYSRPYRCFHQGMGIPGSTVAARREMASEERLRVLYAGPMPAPADLKDFPSYTFIPLLKTISAWPDLHFEVFNSNHVSAGEDDKYQEYIDWFGKQGNGYHRRIPHQELIQQIGEFDYGWMCLHFEEQLYDYPDGHVVMSARTTSYLAAGLPIIIDNVWTAAVELIEKFEAGFVIDEPTPERVREGLRRADPEKHRRGAERLRAYLLEENRAVLNDIAALAPHKVRR